MAVYYVDNAGSDSDTGLVGHPWQTISKVNSVTFSSDDQIIFTAGQTFTGTLTITNSGTSGHHICFGTGRLTGSTADTGRIARSNPAIISCGDNNGITLNEAQYVSLDNFSIQGSGVNTSTGVTTSTGVGVQWSSTQTVNRLLGCRVTAVEVTGCKDGFFFHTNADNQVGFDGLQVWGCAAHACQRVGFQIFNYLIPAPFGNGNKTQFLNCYIGYCQAYDNPGWPGVSPFGVDHGGVVGSGYDVNNGTNHIVEHCLSHDLNIVGDIGPSAGGTSGMASSQVDGTIFRYNEVYNIYARQVSQASIDGVGMDFETGAINCLAEFNYVHDCDGAGFLTGSQVGSTSSNAVRFNVFARNAGNNQSEIYNFGSSGGGETVFTSFYNNTFYGSNGHCYTNQLTSALTDRLWNNIIICKAGSFCVDATLETSNLQGNLYYAIGGGGIKIRPNGTTYTTLAGLRGAGYESSGGSNGVSADPGLSSPASGVGAGFLPDAEVATMHYFDIGVASPAKDAGVDLYAPPYNGTFTNDFHGALTAGHGANIGACLPISGNIYLPIRF